VVRSIPGCEGWFQICHKEENVCIEVVSANSNLNFHPEKPHNQWPFNAIQRRCPFFEISC
jgi:hypothetical protein